MACVGAHAPGAEPSISVLIRARDEAPSIERCLRSIAGQRLRAGSLEVIVVDSGSGDGTPDLARSAGARVIEQPGRGFSFGGALNLAAANAHGELLVALSAHAVPPDPGWLARLLAPFADRRVACVAGDRFDADGQSLRGAVAQDLALLRRRPDWGFSNAAGAFRAALWRQRPFRTDLPGCEDKEWAWHWLCQGMICVIDSSVVVDHDHTHDPLLHIFRRARREAEGYARFLDPETGVRTPNARGLAREWWADLRWYDSAARARLSHRRAARLLGAYVGRRDARRRASPSPERS